MKYLLDTNVFQEIGRTEPHRHLAAWLKQVDDTELAVSTLTVRELTRGIVKLRASKPDVADAIQLRVAAALDAFAERVLPISREIAELWGGLLAQSNKHIDDTGLAATARCHGLIVVTRNLKHFAWRGAATLDPFTQSAMINQA